MREERPGWLWFCVFERTGRQEVFSSQINTQGRCAGAGSPPSPIHRASRAHPLIHKPARERRTYFLNNKKIMTPRSAVSNVMSNPPWPLRAGLLGLRVHSLLHRQGLQPERARSHLTQSSSTSHGRYFLLKERGPNRRIVLSVGLFGVGLGWLGVGLFRVRLGRRREG